MALAGMKAGHKKQGNEGIQTQVSGDACLVVIQQPEPHIKVDGIHE